MCRENVPVMPWTLKFPHPHPNQRLPPAGLCPLGILPDGPEHDQSDSVGQHRQQVDAKQQPVQHGAHTQPVPGHLSALLLFLQEVPHGGQLLQQPVHRQGRLPRWWGWAASTLWGLVQVPACSQMAAVVFHVCKKGRALAREGAPAKGPEHCPLCFFGLQKFSL